MQVAITMSGSIQTDSTPPRRIGSSSRAFGLCGLVRSNGQVHRQNGREVEFGPKLTALVPDPPSYNPRRN